jgi:hypothetical protein
MDIEERLARRAATAVNSALESTLPRLQADGEHLEVWLLGLAMHLYWKLSGRTYEDEGFNRFCGWLVDVAVESHLARFGEFATDDADEDRDTQEQFMENILEQYDTAVDVVEESSKRGLMALHNIMRRADVWPSDWSGAQMAVGTLASVIIFQRAMADTR